MSNDTTPVDPTESVRTLTSAPFKETYMTLREHQDTDKHYIGDSLPIPSLVQMQGVGVTTDVGKLPFPARVDHVHQGNNLWGYFTGTGMTVSPGSVFINNLVHSGWGRNMLASGQVVAIPVPGLYFIHIEFYIYRDGGGNFTNENNFVLYFTNGSQAKVILRQSNFDLPSSMVVTLSDFAIFPNAPSVNDNVQLNIQHNDVVTWTVYTQHLIVTRVASLTSA